MIRTHAKFFQLLHYSIFQISGFRKTKEADYRRVGQKKVLEDFFLLAKGKQIQKNFNHSECSN